MDSGNRKHRNMFHATEDNSSFSESLRPQIQEIAKKLC